MKGTRQGFPLSPLLFILILEILLQNFRNNDKIRGIRVGKQNYKTKAFADDIVLTLEQPLEGTLQLLNGTIELGKLAGFKINKDKTKC